MNTVTDEELKAELSSFGFVAGPITDTTRGILQKKLNSLRNAAASPKTKPQSQPGKKARTSTPPTKVRERFVPLETDFGKEEEEEDEDDHTESSRILSPENHFSVYGGSPYGSRNVRKASPVENFKKLAWGFFSRPLGTSTPCSEVGNKYVGYASNKYKRHSTSLDSDGVRFFESKKISPDISRWISHALIAFFAVLFLTYVAKAHTETVSHGISMAAGFVVSTSRFVYSYAFIPISVALFVGLSIFGIYKLAAYFNYRKAEKNRKLILLVERITDIIYESGSSGVAEPHVRDMIMPPTKRSEMDAKRWQEAARFINNEDSRIRTEIRLISGTECNVWIWVGASKQRWQGTAVLEGSPLARVPEKALTRCLKLRGISFSTNSVERDSIRRELLNKLRPIVPQHMAFASGAESVVYIMLKDLDDAKDVFMAFHSHWFNGNLLSAKYVRDQRYLERFPDANK